MGDCPVCYSASPRPASSDPRQPAAGCVRRGEPHPPTPVGPPSSRPPVLVQAPFLPPLPTRPHLWPLPLPPRPRGTCHRAHLRGRPLLGESPVSSSELTQLFVQIPCRFLSDFIKFPTPPRCSFEQDCVGPASVGKTPGQPSRQSCVPVGPERPRQTGHLTSLSCWEPHFCFALIRSWARPAWRRRWA